MKYQLIVFDFDGTLANSLPFFMSVMDTLADTHGFRRIGTDEWPALRGRDARQLMQHVGLPLWKMPRVSKHFMALMAENIERITLFEGVPEMLRELAGKGMTLAILSSNSHDNVRAVLGAENAQLFRHYECGAALFGKRIKLRRLLARSGVARDQVLCIGDEVRDIEAARSEQLACGAVAWGYSTLESLLRHGPDQVFSQVREIAALAES